MALPGEGSLVPAMQASDVQAQVASELEGDMKVKAVYRLLNGKVTAEKPDLENFLPAQLQQLIGAPFRLLKAGMRPQGPGEGGGGRGGPGHQDEQICSYQI